ncbi:MAG: hypothetical protein M3Z21_17040 [Pseudomonadota bacterium]|nr:hypothetical protein [Pseudomonadota bacterium]
MATRQRDEGRQRILLAQQCARIMAEEGVKDFLTAKRKAATRLGVANRALLPSNAEIERALAEYQRLFKADRQPLRLRTLRQAAVEAMHFFARFRPRLVGGVLAGTADAHSDITLHLFADTPEEVVLFLLEHDIPFVTSERRLNLGSGGYASYPVYGFAAGDAGIDLTVLPPEAERQPPRSPVDGRPMRRAGVAAVQALLNEDAPPPGGE